MNSPLVIPEGARLCRCEGVKPKEHAGHCGKRDIAYILPRSRFVVEVVKLDLLVGRIRLPDLPLCGPCGWEYKEMGYHVLPTGTDLRDIRQSGRLGLPANGRQA